MRLDALSKEAYDLIYRPTKPNAFDNAFREYLQAYSLYIAPQRESLSTKKDTMSKNITDLGRQAQGRLADAGNSSNEHLSHLYSQFEQFNRSHNAMIEYIEYSRPSHSSATTPFHPTLYLIDLYARIKTTKGECDNAITHGISFNRDFVSFRLRVMDH